MRIIISIVFILWQASSYAQLRLSTFNNQDQLSLNHSGNQIGSASFTLTQVNEGFAGMYVNSMGVNSANPFYGYAVGKTAKAWHYYNGISDFWGLNVGGQDRLKVSNTRTTISNSLEVIDSVFLNSELMINTDDQLNSFTDLTIKSNSVNQYGGMYIDVHGSGSSKPFYGYAVDGADVAFNYYNESTNSWNLNVNSFYDVIIAKEDNVAINGSLKLLHINAVAEPSGTIYYYNGHFYGKTTSGVKQLDNTDPALLKDHEDNTNAIKILMEENEFLKIQLKAIEESLNSLEKKFLAEKSN